MWRNRSTPSKQVISSRRKTRATASEVGAIVCRVEVEIISESRCHPRIPPVLVDRSAVTIRPLLGNRRFSFLRSSQGQWQRCPPGVLWAAKARRLALRTDRAGLTARNALNQSANMIFVVDELRPIRVATARNPPSLCHTSRHTNSLVIGLFVS